MRTIITTMIIFFMTCVVMVSAQSKFRQKRAWIIDSFTIEEESLGPFPYILGTINVERDYLVRYFLKGRGIDEDPKDVLSINFRTGEVLVHKKVDYETNRNLTFKFEARDEDYILDTNLRVVINILDINDNAPLFTLPYYETTLEESHLQGELVTTVSASDNDNPTTLNGTFEFALVSVTPKTDNVEFYITQSNTTGNIYFKGCLDYEKAQKYTLLIKATDSGEKVQLSSTSTVVLNIIDKNNHLPEITGHTGPGKIEERESGVEVLRLQVSDKDSRGSPAWKAKFTLHGDPENYFKIHTDPKTNEGILTVIKAMDHEEQTTRKMLVSVENELPYFLCKVKTRTPLHLWDVESNTSVPVLVKPFPVTITVDDVNDPPEFVPPVKIRLITENAKIGTLLETFTVIDPDKTHGNSFHFVKVVDEENWVTVDSLTGQVSVAKVMDRESPSVNHSRYGVIVHAVNKAQPPQTSTGTLIIQFIDENDNVPKLAVDTVSMCLSDEKTMTTISAVDPDLPPYSAPFQYELMEDDGMEGKWKLEPINETTVNLVKENTVYAGHYRIRIKISDNQRYGSVQNLSVTVCDCTGNFNCSVRSFRVQPSLRAIGVIIFTFLLLLAMLMMALMFCKTPVKTMILHDDAPGNLIQSNIEMPGTDCKLPFEIYQLLMSQRSVMMSNGFSKQNSMLHNGSTRYSYRQIQNDNMTTSVGKNGRAYYTDDFYKQVLSNQLDKVGAQEIGSSVSKIRQKRNWVVDIFTMKRGFNGTVGYVSIFGDIEDCDIYGPGVNENPKGIFLINKKTKEMTANGSVYYESRKNFTLIFECAHLQHVYERLAVDVLIEECHEPYFSKNTYIISAEESMLQGTNLLSMVVPNSVQNETLTFTVKVNPTPHYAMFVVSEKLEMSFRGCLDYEEHRKHTVVVEAKDNRLLTPHSSTATVIINVIDKNDHKPVITGKTGSGHIKEREIGAEVYRIQVLDKDSPGSPGWKANFTLHGEKAENFKIEANLKTNEGILSVVKPLDYEETQVLNLTVQVENEEPFFSCSVRKMYYDGKMCDIDYSSDGSSSTVLSFPIIVEDVNDPPEFTDTVKHVTVMENTPSGYSLWTFTVTDQDRNPPNTHKFIKGKDIDNWVTIEPMTGKVSTAKVLDRESPFVQPFNSTYTVILHVVDDGIPPKTGTGTLIIHVLDQNDNAPLLKYNEVTICSPKSTTNITAVDPDLPPFSMPFTYKLQDDQGKWKLEPSKGETVNLVKDSSVYSGSYKLILNITDCGGFSSIQKLSVTVRNCSGDGRHLRRTGAPGIFIIFICLLLILCVLLMAFKCSWCSDQAEKIPFPEIGDSKTLLRCYNEEGPGNDVQIQKIFVHPPDDDLDVPAKQKDIIIIIEKNGKIYRKQRWRKRKHFQKSGEITEKEDLNRKYTISDDSLAQIGIMMNFMIEKKLSSLHDQGMELCDYKPHPYNNEGEPGDPAELDSISLADSQFSLGELENLDSKFHQLAELCRPDLIQQSYMSQASFSSHHYQHHHHHHSHHHL